jgi:hypothetical protein
MRQTAFGIGILLLIALLGSAARAQDTSADLTTRAVEVVSVTNLYGEQTLIARGDLVNNSADMGYTNITLLAEVVDADQAVIGEGFGFLANACGTPLDSWTLQGGDHQTFAIQLELYELDGPEPAAVNITVQADISDAPPLPALADDARVRQITDAEVVMLEWESVDALRFGIGCANDLFTNLRWQSYGLADDAPSDSAHPNAEALTPRVLTQLQLERPDILQRALLVFAPNARRLVYQSDLNAVVTAEPDGSFRRIVFDDLYRRTLQGYEWGMDGAFLAYYFGAFGEEVRYFTATVDGQPLSASMNNSVPSATVPGIAPDGRRAIIHAEIDGVRGYHFINVFTQNPDLLVEAPPMGNNYPAPIFADGPGTADTLYIVQPGDGQAQLYCYNTQTRAFNPLLPLPLRLSDDARAWLWLSPDQNTLALTANGTEGGAWLIDVRDVKTCA